MKSLLTLIGVLLALAVTGALFYGGYLSLVYLWQVYAELDAVIRALLLSAMAIVLIAALIIAGAIKTAGLAAGKNQLTKTKLRAYKSLVELLKPFSVSRPQISQQVCADVLGELSGIEAELQILSAAAVLEDLGKLKTVLRNPDMPGKINELIEKLIKSIRRDLGHGSGYDETRFKFLVTPGLSEKVERQRPGVSL